ncbi:MAG: hypothetical protein FWG38_07665, partial [Defluviitaleaceae bacterium]|nr:hypothetical protein [Defluviitaleaceae bacterium]
FNTGRLQVMEKQLAKFDRDIKKLFDMMFNSDSKAVIKNCEEKIKQLELQQIDMETDIARLKVANGIRYTKEDIITWLKAFTNGDLFDMEFRKRIIDTFINAIYIYDDKIVLYYNLKNSKQVSYIDMLDSTDCNNEGDKSDADVYNDATGGFGYQMVSPSPNHEKGVPTYGMPFFSTMPLPWADKGRFTLAPPNTWQSIPKRRPI